MATKPIPEGFHTLTPYLVVRDGAKAIEFYKQAFGAKVRGIHYMPDGKTILHADLQFGDSHMMLNDEFPQWGALSPLSNGGATSVTMHMYVEDVDRVFNQAVASGATVKMPVMDAFWGDRYGQLVDPFGHQWSVATHKQDLTEEEMIKASKAAMSQMGA